MRLLNMAQAGVQSFNAFSSNLKGRLPILIFGQGVLLILLFATTDAGLFGTLIGVVEAIAILKAGVEYFFKTTLAFSPPGFFKPIFSIAGLLVVTIILSGGILLGRLGQVVVSGLFPPKPPALNEVPQVQPPGGVTPQAGDTTLPVTIVTLSDTDTVTIYLDVEYFALYVSRSEGVYLRGLQFQVVDVTKNAVLEDDFDSISLRNGYALSGQCFVYLLAGTEPTLPDECKTSNTDVVDRIAANAFWIEVQPTLNLRRAVKVIYDGQTTLYQPICATAASVCSIKTFQIASVMMDRYLVRNVDFAIFSSQYDYEVMLPGIGTPSPSPSEPLVPYLGATWQEADAYCRSRSSRLPSVAELRALGMQWPGQPTPEAGQFQKPDRDNFGEWTNEVIDDSLLVPRREYQVFNWKVQSPTPTANLTLFRKDIGFRCVTDQ